MVEESAGSLAEANDHILAGQEKNIGHIEEVAIHTGEVAGYTKAFVLGSSPGWHLGCSHSCCLQRYCLGVDIGSCLLDSGEFTLVLYCVVLCCVVLIVLCCDRSKTQVLTYRCRERRGRRKERYIPTLSNARAAHLKLKSRAQLRLESFVPQKLQYSTVVTSSRHPNHCLHSHSACGIGWIVVQRLLIG
jgi:hypothetical protein